ncbi:asparagine synthase (glutamine-hydrolyzing) [Clostridium thermobutyricum]|uniref:asparagine synthase (glutamine-hydrolyzing) n=1 Tax=Clostridium thermobutyricum TaxID=29372 RepID=UPI003F525154
MCGFIGVLKNDINEEDVNQITKGSEVIIHRGPDDSKSFIDENIILTFRRLSIIDLENGAQPFNFYNKYIVVFNGEIYNFSELREELSEKGYEFKTNSEIEVIATLYDEYKKDFISYLRGMFAIVIYDKEERKVIITRDHFGIKPLYYFENEKGLYFSSELKSLWAINENLTYNKDEINNYLTVQYIPGEKTLFNEIKTLRPGYFIEKSIDSDLEINKYFELELNPMEESDKEKLKKEIYNSLEDSVKKHMVSDVPVATFLSSGIDSSITTYLAWKLNPEITAYSIGFNVEGYDETPYAKKFADDFGIKFKCLKLDYKDYVRSLPKIIYHMDTPIADPSIIPLYYICKEVSNKFKVVLSGEGSDEFFGGYNIYTEDNSLKVFEKMPKGFKKLMLVSSKLIPNHVKGKSFIERGCTDLEDRYVGNARIFKEEEKHKIINNYKENMKSTDITKEFFRKVENLDNVCKRQYVDINTWLVGDILSKADRMSMANSLELRVPFLDKEVFRVASKLKLEDKINGFTTKHMLREAFKGILPDYVYEKKKLGYPVPIRVWLKDELYDWAKEIILSNPVKEINTEVAIKMLEKHRSTKVDYSRKIWSIIVYIIWYRLYIDKSMLPEEEFIV